jgi:phosphohistidine phosphatase
VPSLYLIRHAIAEDRGERWPDDAKRPLTHRGIEKMHEVVAGLRALDAVVDVVLSSPLVRAKQTADILLEGLKPAPELVVTAALAPGSTPAQVAEDLARHDARGALVLVGHEPGLGELGAWLIGARTPLGLKKGGVCLIEVPNLPPTRPGQLVWLATPGMLRALGQER